MRTIKYGATFRRDYKRETRGRHQATLDSDLLAVVRALASDQTLPRRHHDHPLRGEWGDHRDCHIKPVLVLIYRKPDSNTLELIRLGSHSEIGL